MSTIDPTNREATLSELERRTNTFNSLKDSDRKVKKPTKGTGIYSGESLRFPLDVNKSATYMEFSTFQFESTGSANTSTTAFSNVVSKFTKKELDKIYLPSCQTSLQENQAWDTSPTNVIESVLAGAFKSGEMSGAITGAKEHLGKQIGLAAPSFKTVGAAVVEQTALRYNGPQQRQITCKYILIPRNKDETEMVDKIIRTFRFHSAPTQTKFGELTGADSKPLQSLNVGTRSYKFPSLFEIRWVVDSKDNSHLPKYNACYCESVSVQYGDENFTTFHNSAGAPVTYNLELTFKELEFPTKRRIGEGF